ncbi:MAG: hypothetical protein II859_09250, partial [Bacteroidales bacterium]|nr:hypothetical protein [Bacteroidales bacterium]
MKKHLLLTLSICFALVMSAMAQTPDGTEANPYPIRTKAQLISLAERVNAGGEFYFTPTDSTYATTGANQYKIPDGALNTCFKLVDDIEFNSGDVAACAGVKQSGWTEWIRLGIGAHRFQGTLDGDFHVVSGIYVKQAEDVGFFGAISNATIKNIGVVNAYLGNTGDFTGGIIGRGLGGLIEKCFFAGTIETTGDRTGGIAGQVQGGITITTCYASASIQSYGTQVGGIVGWINAATPASNISNVYSSCIVHGDYQYTGGIVGDNTYNNANFTNCYFDKQLMELNYPAYGDGSPHETSEMTSNNWKPSADFAILGNGYYPYLGGFDINNKKIVLSVTPLVLPAGATLTDMSSVSAITLGGSSQGVTWTETERVGIGSLSGNTLNVTGECYVVLKATSGGVSRDYVLQVDKSPKLGTETNPFPIDTKEDLTTFRKGINTGAKFAYKHFTIPAKGENTCFLQTVDITLPNSNWESISNNANCAFKGTYDGGNHKVSGWTCSTEASALFSYTDGATIKNLTVHDAKSAVMASLIYSMQGGLVDNCHSTGSTVTKGGLVYQTASGSYSPVIQNSTNSNSFTSTWAGGIISVIRSEHNTVINCHNYGNINGSGSDAGVGGIVGGNPLSVSSELTITRCSNRGTITNTHTSKASYVGGILGHNGDNTTISYCRNIGDVRGAAQFIGGIAGVCGTGAVTYCYNLGRVYTHGTSAWIGQNMGGICGSGRNITYSFNAGKVTNRSGYATYAISAGATANVCFNAGDITGGTSGTYAFREETTNKETHYSIGRVRGNGTVYLGGCYYDATRVPPTYTGSSNATAYTVAQFNGTSSPFTASAHTDDWVCAANTYPRIKGLDTCRISKVLALPIVFSGNDNVDSVSQDFTIRSDWDIVWEIEGTSGATISAPVNNYQTVTLPTTKTGGNIILKARYEDTCYYRITLVMAVTAPTSALTVESLTELETLRTNINSGTAFTYKNTPVPAGGKGTTFSLTTDLTLPSSNWDPIGKESTPFMGIFEGNGHTIAGLKQSSVQYAGLFNFVKGGTINNLKLTGINVTSYQHVGGLCTYLQNGTISNCQVSGVVSYDGNYNDGSTKYKGSFVGTMSNKSRVANCYSFVEVKSTLGTYAGGIVGYASSTVDTIIHCTNAGRIYGAPCQAGICGYNGAIIQCVNYGSVEGISSAQQIAGIVSESGSVKGCVNSGRISVPQLGQGCRVAGISLGSVYYSYNVGEIIGNNATKTVGVSTGVCTQCYNAGKVTGDHPYAVTDNTSSTRCYYDNQMSVSLTGVGESKATIDMCGNQLKGDNNNKLNQSQFVFATNMYPRVKGIEKTPASRATAAPVMLGVDETVSLVNTDFHLGGCDSNVVWTSSGSTLGISTTCTTNRQKVTINSIGMPVVYAAVNDTIYKQVKLQSKFEAIVIKNATELANFRDGINSGAIFYYRSDSTFHTTNLGDTLLPVPIGGEGVTFRLATDIDLGGTTWTSIGTSTNAFKGSFEGQNFTISDFKLGTGSYQGLFGKVIDGNIQDLTLTNVTTASTAGQYSAALLGYISGSTIYDITIENCEIIGGSTYAGALAGYVSQTGIYRTHLYGNTIQGAGNVGGIIGAASIVRLESFENNQCTISSTGAYTGGVIGTFSGNTCYVLNGTVAELNLTSSSANTGGIAGSASSGSIYNVHVESGIVDAHAANVVGGILGAGSCMTIYSCSNNADVKGNNYVSGIMGRQSSCTPDLYDVTNTGDVTGNDYVSGIFCNESASARKLTVYRAVNAGKISGHNYVAGIRATNSILSGSTVYNSVNLGEVEGNNYVGGIIANSTNNVYQCMNAGPVHGNKYVGGIVGNQIQPSGSSFKTNNCISVGQVWGNENVGNIAGACDEGAVTNTYYDNQMSPDYKGIGATSSDVAGVTEGRLTKNMIGSNISVTGFTTATGIYPRPSAISSTDGAKVAAAPVVLPDDPDVITPYLIPGSRSFLITPTTTNNVEWNRIGTALIKDGINFKPDEAGRCNLEASIGEVAKSVTFVVGVSKELPCIIKDQTELDLFTQYVNQGITFYYETDNKHFRATKPADLLTGVTINPGGAEAFFKLDFDPTSWSGRIGTTKQPFLGDFNGGGHTVKGVTSATTDTCGFFGYNAGTIYDLTIEDPEMTDASHNMVGALCGFNTGTITNCHVINGTVKGTKYVGGLVGRNQGYVEYSHNSATVSGTDYVAGVAGSNTNTVRYCFNMGDISASASNLTYLGGVTGQSSTSLSYCYNAGNITATGETSNNVGGVTGYNSGSTFGSCYNIGEVTVSSTSTKIGGVAGNSDKGNSYISSLAFDRQLCTLTNAFEGSDGNATVTGTQNMTGSSLQSVLGSDHWVYTDGLYPRLATMENLEASVVSATPVNLVDGEKVTSVKHDFTVNNANNVIWSVDPTTSQMALNMENVPAVQINRCGTPTLLAKQGAEGKEVKKVALYIDFTASVETNDTACGGDSYEWEVNHVIYTSTGTLIYSALEDGCPVVHTLHLVIPDPLVLSTSYTDEQCFEAKDGTASVAVTGGFGQYQYEWKNKTTGNVVGNTATVTNLAPGTYVIRVTDKKPVPKEEGDEYCYAEEEVTITAAEELKFKLDTLYAGCYGAVDGMFQVSVEGGMPGYTLSWKRDGLEAGSRSLLTPQDNFEVNSLPNGVYRLTIKDSNNCAITLDDFTMANDAQKYVITAYSDSKQYDGQTLDAAQYTLKIGDGDPMPISTNTKYIFGNGDTLKVQVQAGDCLDAGVYPNAVTSYKVVRGTQDVTCSYNFEIHDGLVTIEKRHVTLTSRDSLAFRNTVTGCLQRQEVVVTGDGFTDVDAGLISYTNWAQICDNGDVVPNAFEINWNGVHADNYEVTTNFGTLTLIENGILKVTAVGVEKTYDAVPVNVNQNINQSYHISAFYERDVVLPSTGATVKDTIFYTMGSNNTIQGESGILYTVNVVMNDGYSFEVTNADTVENKVTSVTVTTNSGEDITSSFTKVLKDTALIQINPIEITMTSYGGEWTYDAQSHSRPGVSIQGSFHSSDVDMAPAANTTVTNAGKYINTITYGTTSSFKEQNYKITKNEDTLLIHKRKLYLRGVDKLVDYQSGVTQSTTLFTYDNLIAGHTASGVSYIAEGESVGDHTGVFSGTLVVKDADNNDVTNNYDTVQQPGILGVQSPNALLKIKSATQSRVYDGTVFTAQTYEVNYKGVRVNPIPTDPHRFRLSSGDTVEVIPTGTGVTGQIDVGSVKNTFTHQIHPIANHSLYTNLEGDTGMVSVTKRSVTLTSGSLTRAYNGGAISNNTVSESGALFADGEGVDYYTYNNPGTWTQKGVYQNTFTYTLKDNTNPSNYDIESVAGLLTINKAVLTVTADNKTRKYGEPNEFTCTITGYENGEDISVITGFDGITYECPAGQFSNIGNNYDITPVVTGLSADNYTFVPAIGHLTIEKRPLTVTASAPSVVYDGQVHDQTTNPPTSVNYTNLATNDAVTSISWNYSRVPGGDEPMNISDIKIFHTEGSSSTEVTNNYTASSAGSYLTITPKTLKIKVDDATKPYDGQPLVASSYTIDSTYGLADGDVIENVLYTGFQITVGPSTGSINTTELRVINPITGLNVFKNSYILDLTNANLEVTPNDNMVINVSDASQQYNADNLSIAATVSGYAGKTAPTVQYAEKNNGTWGQFSSTQPSRKDVGETEVKVRATLANHNTKEKEYKLTVTEAPLTISLVESKTFDGKIFTSTFSDENTHFVVTGLKGNERITQGTVTSTSANIGTYTSTTGTANPSDFECSRYLSNYHVTYVLNQTISEATLNIALTDSKTYDGSKLTSTYSTDNTKFTVSGLVDGDDLSGSVESYSKDAGDYTYNPTSPALPATPSFTTTKGISNYNVVYNLTQTINKKAVTLTSANKNKEYDGSPLTNDSTALATETGWVGTEGATYTFTGSQTDVGHTANAFSYTLKAGTLADNYDIQKTEGTLEVKQNTTPIIVHAPTSSKTYDGTALTDNGCTAKKEDGTTYQLPSGHHFEYTMTPASTITNVGNDVDNVLNTVKVIKGTNEDVSSFYTFGTSVPGKLTINKREITLTVDNSHNYKPYDGTALSVPYTNVTVGGDSLATGEALVSGTITTDGTAVGTYSCTQGSLQDGGLTATASGFSVKNAANENTSANYSPKFSTTLKINQTNLTINLNVTKKYDGAVFTTTLNEVGNGTHTLEDGTLTVSGLAQGDKLSGTITSMGKDVGSYTFTTHTSTPNLSTTNGISNYNVNYALTQVITQRSVIVTPQSHQFTYTGLPQTWHEYDITGDDFVSGEGFASVTFDPNSKIQYVEDGTVDNTITGYTLANNTLLGNYIITHTAKGALTMDFLYHADLTLTARDSNKTYDGTALTNHAYDIHIVASDGTNSITQDYVCPVAYNGVYTLPNGDVLTVTFDPWSTITDFSSSGTPNRITGVTITNGTHNVSGAYTIQPFVDGTLRINKRDMTVTAASRLESENNALSYTGQIQSDPTYKVTSAFPKAFVGNDTISVNILGEIQYPAQSPVTNRIVGHTFTGNSESNYNITFVDGKLEMKYTNPIELTLTAGSGSWTYDGNAHTLPVCTLHVADGVTNTDPVIACDNNGIGTYTFSNGDVITVKVQGSVTTVSEGTKDNVPSVVSILHGTDNVSSNYNTSHAGAFVNGTLKINPIDNVTITITGHSDELTYDGNTHSVSGYDKSSSNSLFDLTKVNLATGNSDQITDKTNAGTYNMGLNTNSFTSSDANFAHVTWSVTDGKLVINKKQASITAVNETLHYTGQLQNAENTVTKTGFVNTTDENSVGYTVSGSITYPSESPATKTVTITTGNANYDITPVNGTLTMDWGTKTNLTITACNGSWTYNGTAHSNDKVKVKIGDGTETEYATANGTTEIPLNNGDKLKVQVQGEITHVSSATVYNQILNYSITNGTQNVAGKYNVTTQNGTLTINPLAVTVTAASHTGANAFDYNGQAHSDATYTMNPTSLPLNTDKITVTVTGSQTLPGTSANVVTAQVTAGNPADYTITPVNGTLEVKINETAPICTLNIKPSRATKVYDGTALSSEGYTLTYNNQSYTVGSEGYYQFDNGDRLYVELEGSNTHVANNGQTGSVRKVKETTGVSPVVKHGTVDVTSAYYIVKDTAHLIITKRPLTLTSASDSWTFDNAAHSNHNVTVDGWIAGDGTIAASNYTGWTSRTAIGSQDNKFEFTFPSGVQETDYDTTKVFGTLTVNPKDMVTVTIVGTSDTKTYNGGTQTVTGYTVTHISNPLYHESDITYNGGDAHKTASGMKAGTYTMPLSVSDFANNNNNFNNKVTFVVTPGTLTINPITTPIVITADNDSKKYDGTALTKNTYTYTQNVLKEGDALTATVEGSRTDYGQAPNRVTTYQVKHGNEDVTNCYTFGNSVDGTLTITKRDVTLTSATDSKDYNGTALTKNAQTDVAVSGDGFVTNQGATYSITGTQTAAGSSPNTFTYTLENGTLADNYNITTVPGTLTVNKKNITVNIAGKQESKVYNGSEQTTKGYDVTFTDNLSDSYAYTKNDFTFSGDSTVSRTYKGTTNMNLAQGQFTNNNGNYNPTFQVTDGKLTITPVTDAITVNITGNNLTHLYDGNAYTASGYTWTSTNSLYTDASFTCSNAASVSRADVGTTNMGLKGTSAGAENQFSNTDTNFTGTVTFTIVEDGYVTINKASAVMTVTCPTDITKVYNGSGQHASAPTSNVTGATFTYSTTNNGTDWDSNIPERTDVGTTTVYVKASHDNYQDAFCNYDLTITKRPMTITACSANLTYTGQAQNCNTYTVEGWTDADQTAGTTAWGVVVNGSITYPSQGSMPTTVDTATFNFAHKGNYDITLVPGALTMSYGTPIDITFTTATQEWTYDGQPHDTLTFAVTGPDNFSGHSTLTNN